MLCTSGHSEQHFISLVCLELPKDILFEAIVKDVVSLINDYCGKTQPTVGDTITGQVVKVRKDDSSLSKPSSLSQ